MTVVGLYTQWELQGKACIELEKVRPDKKNILSSRSFGKPITTLKEMKEAVAYHATLAAAELRAQKSVCSFILVIIETNRFRKDLPQYFNLKCMELDQATNQTSDLIQYAHRILQRIFREGFRYKRAGVLLEGIKKEDARQLDLFIDQNVTDKRDSVIAAIDKINDKHGRHTIHVGTFMPTGNDWAMRRAFHSPCYTTRFRDIPIIKV
jgi:DNA polymerase V